MPMCINSGLGILVYDSKVKATDYKFNQFDEASQKYGVDLINNIPVTETKNVTIKVTATLVDVVNTTSKKNEKQIQFLVSIEVLKILIKFLRLSLIY